MVKHIALAFGLTVAAAGYAYAQQTPPGTDRPGGESSGQSAKPQMDKKGGQGTMAPPAAGTPTGTMNTPPGTDGPRGDSSTTSADPKKK